MTLFGRGGAIVAFFSIGGAIALLQPMATGRQILLIINIFSIINLVVVKTLVRACRFYGQ